MKYLIPLLLTMSLLTGCYATLGVDFIERVEVQHIITIDTPLGPMTARESIIYPIETIVPKVTLGVKKGGYHIEYNASKGSDIIFQSIGAYKKWEWW